ncbi:MAG: PIG-L deacetylase family protein [Candidatus Thermoplasmatota archaeon]|nr:PIG-L deacetylase family protein [Candidatus Thermoplasmatota archaeon]
MKVLVVSPHPDDEVLGCGGTISKHVSNADSVDLCIVTRTFPPDWPEEFHIKRLKEIAESSKLLGISNIHNLDFETVKLDTVPQFKINKALDEVLSNVKPDILYIPFKGDLHKDHRITFESSLVSARPRGCFPKKILSYETLSETSWGSQISPFIPNYFVNIEGHLEKKLEAMKCYISELKDWPDQRSLESIEIQAKYRGSEVGYSAAEAFRIVRFIDE